MKYIILSEFTTFKLERMVQEYLDENWDLYGNMTNAVYEKEIKFYQPMIKKD